LLMKNGAVVHGARDEVELQRLVDRLGVKVVVAEARSDRSRLNQRAPVASKRRGAVDSGDRLYLR
jgi:hypothetical protein